MSRQWRVREKRKRRKAREKRRKKRLAEQLKSGK